MASYSFALLFVLFGAACALKLERNEACSSTSSPCFEGLKCEGGVCVENSDASLCHKKLLESHESTLLGRFTPKCTEEGHFAPQQCRGSVCGCVDKDGQRLNDFDSVPIYKSRDQTCHCAQDFAEYRKLRIIGRKFSCDSMGNYKKIQCIGSQCYCADEFGKALLEKPSVHVAQRHTLQC